MEWAWKRSDVKIIVLPASLRGGSNKWGYAITKVCNLVTSYPDVTWPGGWRNVSRWHLSFQVWRPNDDNVRFEFFFCTLSSTTYFHQFLIGVKVLVRWGVGVQLKMPLSWILIWVQVTVVSPGHPPRSAELIFREYIKHSKIHVANFNYINSGFCDGNFCRCLKDNKTITQV
jgi:hypothetical protein